MNLIERVHAVVLCGGSAFGLDAAAGVMQFLEEQDIGFDTGCAVVPIVPAAVLYDLAVGDSKARPDKTMGYRACQQASTGKVQEGNVGAGTGATVAKFLGMDRAMKGGIGTFSVQLKDGTVVGAVTAVNAFGDILDWQNARLLAAPGMDENGELTATVELMKAGVGATDVFGTNTTLSVVATNAVLTKESANKVAQVAHNGLARAISPVHTMADGDVIYALSAGTQTCDVNTVASVACEVVAESVKRAVLAAESVAGFLSVRDVQK